MRVSNLPVKPHSQKSPAEDGAQSRLHKEASAASLSQPSATQPELPIMAFKPEIMQAISRHQVVIIAGDTGSGKTTQIPRFCLELGRGQRKLIGCTQPRRLAAVSVAERVAQELSSAPGALVGWQHRFGRKLSESTRLKFMTDGILLAETRNDPELRRYDTIMVDEVHERTLNIDFLLGYLKRLLPRRPDLKVIISSATLDVERFSEFFDGAPAVTVPGRMFPVEVRYRPPQDDDSDLAGMVADGVEELLEAGSGDILVFLPGERDIRAAGETLTGRGLRSTEIIPLMASLPPAEQRRAFRVLPGKRRVILSTNVAETSLTIPGIRMVVDGGLARINRYNHRTQTQRLHIEKISRASAEQRKGRCGRVAAGVCVRLYSEEDLSARDAYTVPEIRRSSLAGVILMMADLRLGAIESFPFLDPPSAALVREGYRELRDLAAMREDGRLTKLGRQLARIPIEPRLARILIAAAETRVLQDALVVVAALAGEDPRLRPLDRQEAADKAHARFAAQVSDFSSVLLLWRWYQETLAKSSRGAARRRCIEQFLSFRRMEEWVDIRNQLEGRLRTFGLHATPPPASGAEVALHRALLSGMLGQIGLRDPERNDYLGARGTRFSIHPGSALFKKPPKWVMAAELVDTARLYARRVAALNPEWIEPAAAHLCKYSYHSEYWDGKAGTARALERVTLYGLVVAEGRRRDISRIDPAMSRAMFINRGLVGGELPPALPQVVRANLKLFEKLRTSSRKTRGGVDLDEELFAEAYDRCLPQEVVNLAALRAWLKQGGAAGEKKLALDEGMFSVSEVSAALYPDTAWLAGHRIRLRYRHDPGGEDDGVTCEVPIAALPWLRRWPIDWLVPGMLQEKVAWLVGAAVGKTGRAGVSQRRLLPQVMDALKQPGKPLTRAVADAVRRFGGLHAPPEVLDDSLAPPHLRMRISVRDHSRREVFATRQLEEAEEFHAELARLGALPSDLGGRVETLPQFDVQRFATLVDRTNLNEWACGDLPEAAEIGQAGWPILSYPALVDAGKRVDLRWFRDQAEAAAAHLSGVRRLYALKHASTAGKKRRTVPQAVALGYLAIGGQPDKLWDEIVLAAVDAVMLPVAESPPRTRADFEARWNERAGGLEAAIGERWHDIEQALRLGSQAEQDLEMARLPEVSVADIHEQIAWLVFPGFAQHVAPARLKSYARYFGALRLRIQRARDNPARDAQRFGQLETFWRRYTEAIGSGVIENNSSSAMDEYRWAVEEYRVSLWAQELGTAGPVSPQRLERLWERATMLP